MAGADPPSTTWLLASPKSWMPTSVGTTIRARAYESMVWLLDIIGTEHLSCRGRDNAEP
jgi:hypothetical protein